MRAKQLIEKLEDLATFLTLAANDAGKEEEKSTQIDPYNPDIGFWEGKKVAYNAAFKKLDAIIKEAKQ